MKSYVALVTLVALAMCLNACAPLATQPAPVVPTQTFSPTQGVPPTAAPTVATPDAMPTAEPLWTPTPPPAPSATPPPQATPAPTSAEQTLDASVVAVVNGEVVSRAKFDAQLAQAETYLAQQPGFDPGSEAGQQSLLQLREQVLDWLIDQVLVRQAAAEAGVSVSQADIDAQIKQMRGNDETRFRNWMAANGFTDESLREQVRLDLLTNAMRDRVTAKLSRRTLQVQVRHILLSSEEAATAALKRLQAGADFAKVSREVSEDEITRANGGDLGYIPRGVMPPSFDEAAFSLKAGEISGLVRSDYGFHIIQVLKIAPNRAVSDELWPVVQQNAFDQWLADLRARATIVRNQDLVRG